MARAQRRRFHFIYKTTCSVTGRYYLGMHSTDNLDDSYIGSGQQLWRSIKKHGLETHSLQILEHLSSREELVKRETEIINEDVLKDPLCMNLKEGGHGGWDHINVRRAMSGWTDKEREAARQNMRRLNAQMWEGKREMLLRNLGTGMLGKTHSEESRRKMSEAHKGSNNQAWVKHLNSGEVKRIPTSQLQEHLSSGWQRGR